MWLAWAALAFAAKPTGKLALVGDAANTLHGDAASAQLSELNGLADAAKDLLADEKRDEDSTKDIDTQLAKLQSKRSALLDDSTKKRKEIFLLRTEVSTLGKGLSSADMKEVLTREGDMVSMAAETDAQVSAAAARAEAQAEAAATAQAQAQAELAAKAQAEAAAQAAAAAKVQAEALEAQRAAAEATARQAAAEAAAQKANAAAALSKAKAAQAQAAQAQAQAQASASSASSQSSSASTSRESVRAAARAAARSSDSDESLDDDGLSSYLKDEDGEDEQGDADYNDSANALADAIGWDRGKVEKNANNAVKALTDAIGGKKVVNQLKGMMAGMSAVR